MPQLGFGLESQLPHPIRLVGHSGEVGEGHAAVTRDRNNGPVFRSSDPPDFAELGSALVLALLLGKEWRVVEGAR